MKCGPFLGVNESSPIVALNLENKKEELQSEIEGDDLLWTSIYDETLLWGATVH